MARTYQTVNWQDGTVVTPAKVTVAGTEYEVTPAVKSGQTPLNATNLRKMDNEIKRIVEEDLPATEDVKLIAVSDTEPSEYEEGDKYYNTEDNKIYTAIDNEGTTEWDDGEEPREGISYIVFSTQSSYAYDGTTLVSVGGGSGSSDIVVVGTDTPTEDTKLYIEEEDLDFRGLEIANEYTTGDNVAYSADYINGTVLYNNPTGTSSNISLGTDDVSNYRYIEITTKNADNAQETFSIFKFDTSLSSYTMMGETVSSSSFNIFTKTYTKGTNQLTASSGKLYSGGSVSTYEVFKIIKVIGYK